MTTPGAFHAYYAVKLRRTDGAAMPASWMFNSLTFNGKVKINKVSSRINVDLTKQYSPLQYLAYLDIAALEQGEVNWIINGGEGCTEDNSNDLSTTLNFPQPSQAEVTLFTIVVDAAPGDQLEFVNYSAFVYDCKTYHCNGQIPIKTGGNTLINMPNPPTCAPTPNLSYNFINGFVLVNVNNVFATQPIARFDALLHIVPNMNGFTSDFNLSPADIAPAQGGVIQNNIMEKRKNPDGSFDVYFSFKDFDNPPPATSSFPALAIQLIGYNSSQGGTLTISVTSSRIARGSASDNPVTCSLASTLPKVVNIPGFSTCSNDLAISWSHTTDAQNCDGVVTFTITHSSPTPIVVTNAYFVLVFDPIGVGAVITAGTPSTTLPNASTYGAFSYNTSQSRWEYSYEFNGPGTISITSGTKISVPFSFTSGCLNYNVNYAEVKMQGSADRCALSTPSTKKDLCNPKVHGWIKAFETYVSLIQVPQYDVKLQSINEPGYILEDVIAWKNILSALTPPKPLLG